MYSNRQSASSSTALDFGLPRIRHDNYGMDSARASTVGTDHAVGASSPWGASGSRVALNSGLSDGDQSRRDSLLDSPEISPLTPINGMPTDRAVYVSIPASEKTLDDEKQDLPQVASPPSPPGATVPQPEAAIVLARRNRLAWIDGLRGLASLVIFTHHFADLTWSQSHPQTLAWGTVYSFIRNGQLAVGMYFLLGGRVLVHGFQRSAFTPPRMPKDSHGAVIEGAPPIKAPGPRWLSLASSLFRRSIRLAFPAIIVGFIQWRVCMDGLVTNAPMQAAQVRLTFSYICSPPGSLP
jgi:hypothetical protein